MTQGFLTIEVGSSKHEGPDSHPPDLRASVLIGSVRDQRAGVQPLTHRPAPLNCIVTPLSGKYTGNPSTSDANTALRTPAIDSRQSRG
jgi:hypothetical protein